MKTILCNILLPIVISLGNIISVKAQCGTNNNIQQTTSGEVESLLADGYGQSFIPTCTGQIEYI